MAETGLVVLGLYFAATYLMRAVGASARGIAVSELGGGPEMGLPMILTAMVPIGILLLRRRVVGCLVRDAEAADGRISLVRPEMIRPWIVLLGVWFVMQDGPLLVRWGYERLTGARAAWLPPLRALAGLVLVPTAGWLSRLLAGKEVAVAGAESAAEEGGAP